MKKRTVYVCKNCDYQTSQWLGRCPECGSYDKEIISGFDFMIREIRVRE